MTKADVLLPGGESLKVVDTSVWCLTLRRLFLSLFLVVVLWLAYLLTAPNLCLSFTDGGGTHLSPNGVPRLFREWAPNDPHAGAAQGPGHGGILLLSTEDLVIGDRLMTKEKRKAITRAKQAMYGAKAADLANKESGKPVTREYNMTRHFIMRRAEEREVECVHLKVQPPVPICLYDSQRDVFVSKQIRESGIWEGHIVRRFQRILADDILLGVIDVGANLGEYSLIAASMGHRVLSVEPWEPSLRRFHMAASMAAVTDRIRVLQNAVTDARSRVYLKVNPDNQGDVRPRPERCIGSGKGVCDKNITQTIHLNDLIPFVDFNKAVLKLDIQGWEHRALLHAEALLDAVYTPYIFMEWVIMRGFWVTPTHESLDKALVRRMVRLLTDRDYRVFSLVSGKELDISYWHGWPEDVLWVHSKAL